jgi:UDP-glucose 4-epimerase
LGIASLNPTYGAVTKIEDGGFRMHVLVTGGAGYIGSHMVRMLRAHGHSVVVLDNLSNGHADAVPAGVLHVGDVLDRALLDDLFSTHSFDAVLHFAGRIEVGESVREPGLYYRDNVCGSRALIDAACDAGIERFVFSSTAAVYGEPESVPIAEDHPRQPGNPYGASKWMVERMLADESATRGLRSVSLRYFNAAGAAGDGVLGERHDPETHLIPLACQAANGRRGALTVFGRDYPTADGTCVRDYIHVDDLCEAHLLALRYLAEGGATTSLNLGYGRGTSVQEVIDAVGRVSGHAVPFEDGPRRDGDPSRLIAEPARARSVLGWSPSRDDLDRIVRDAWDWETRLAAAEDSPIR